MTPTWVQLTYLACAVCFILALKGLSGPKTARSGNLVGAAGAVVACAVPFFYLDLEHVPLILAAIVVAKNPVQYGFNVTPAEAIAYEKVSLPRAIDLRRVAEWTGQTIDDVQALNPELRRWTTPLATKNYEIKLPAGTASAFSTRLAAASPDELASLKFYTVRRGESIATIARKLSVSRTDLAEANQLSLRAPLHAGQDLVIPRAPTGLVASASRAAAPDTVASRSISGTGSVTPTRHDAPASTLTYKVKRGDTLSSIARLFDTTVDKIRSLNRLPGSHISPGDQLKILAQRSR